MLEAMLGAWRPKPGILTFISRALRPFWGCLWVTLGHPGAILRNLGLSWGHFGPSCGYLGQSEAVLGPSLGHPGAFRGHLGGYLGPSEAVLGPSGAVLGPSWGHLGAILGPSGAIWGHLGAILGHRKDRTSQKRKEIDEFSKMCTAPRREHNSGSFGGQVKAFLGRS